MKLLDVSERNRRPMIFSDADAFERLRERGYVLTARASEHDERPVWIRRTRNGEKEFDAVRYHVGEFEWAEFVSKIAHPLHDRAGFETGSEWCDRIVELQGERPERVYVYSVVRREQEDGEI
jgi:DNA-binding MarR family transcriptional regulator